MNRKKKNILAAAAFVFAACILTGCGERVEDALQTQTEQKKPGETEVRVKDLIEEDGTEYSKAELYYVMEAESIGPEPKEALSESAVIVEEPYSDSESDTDPAGAGETRTDGN